jgi:serine/threonine-protein kinase
VIVHRDMKPENIFVTSGQTTIVLKALTRHREGRGNDGQNNRRAPDDLDAVLHGAEQALGNPVDARTDVYAVGVIMHEMFAGRRRSRRVVHTSSRSTSRPSLSRRAARREGGPTQPLGLADIITRCMQKNRRSATAR